MWKKVIRAIAPYGLVAAIQRRNARHANVIRSAAFYGQFVRNGGLVFDVGANRGNRVDAFRRLGANVHAFEPQPNCADRLRKRFNSDTGVVVHQIALGAEPGFATMHVSSRTDVLSTLSSQFVDRVSTSGRFSKNTWDQACRVEVKTLKQVIETFGKPEFIKIDVEGFESEVLSGLTTSVEALSFEWTPELFDLAEACITRCVVLGMCEFNLSFGESLQLSQAWCCDKDILSQIFSCRKDRFLFGDIYARIPAFC